MGIKISGTGGSIKFSGTGGGIKMGSPGGGGTPSWQTGYHADFTTASAINLATSGDGSYSIAGRTWNVFGTSNANPTFEVGSNGISGYIQSSPYAWHFTGLNIPWSSLVPAASLASNEVIVLIRIDARGGMWVSQQDTIGIFAEINYDGFDPSNPLANKHFAFLQSGKDLHSVVQYAGINSDYTTQHITSYDMVLAMHMKYSAGTLTGDYYIDPWRGSMPDISAMTKVKSTSSSLSLTGNEDFAMVWYSYGGQDMYDVKELKVLYK